MSDELKPADPKCPACDGQPIKFGYQATQLPQGQIISVIWCTDCGFVLNMQQIGQQQPAVIDPTSIGTRLIRGRMA